MESSNSYFNMQHPELGMKIKTIVSWKQIYVSSTHLDFSHSFSKY